jgi:hypothetical protein
MYVLCIYVHIYIYIYTHFLDTIVSAISAFESSIFQLDALSQPPTSPYTFCSIAPGIKDKTQQHVVTDYFNTQQNYLL